jgi:hypothetical protein
MALLAEYPIELLVRTVPGGILANLIACLIRGVLRLRAGLLGQAANPWPRNAVLPHEPRHGFSLGHAAGITIGLGWLANPWSNRVGIRAGLANR